MNMYMIHAPDTVVHAPDTVVVTRIVLVLNLYIRTGVLNICIYVLVLNTCTHG